MTEMSLIWIVSVNILYTFLLFFIITAEIPSAVYSGQLPNIKIKTR